MWLFVGLGNHGDNYAKNRHNIGFMVIDSVLKQHKVNFPDYRLKFQAMVSEGRIDGQKVILLKPQTYMNNSGNAVGQATKFYKIKPDNIIVFHDELDIALGGVRIKKGGGNAGHNGLKSIQAHLNTPDFWRVRIGIGRPENKEQVSNYVLSDFSKNENESTLPLIEVLGGSVREIIDVTPEAYGEIIKRHIR